MKLFLCFCCSCTRRTAGGSSCGKPLTYAALEPKLGAGDLLQLKMHVMLALVSEGNGKEMAEMGSR